MTSEQVALCHPVMPVANGLGGGFVGIDGGQLGKRDGHLTPLPTDQHEHVSGAGILRRHTPHFDSVSFAERRDDFGSDALGLEGESDFVIEIVIPAHRLLFRPVGVHDGLVMDAIFPDRVFLQFFHGFAFRMRRSDVRPICNRREISDLLMLRQTGADTLAQELREHREQASHGSSGGRRQIECFSQRYETDSEMLQFL